MSEQTPPSRIHPLSTIDTTALPADGGPVYNRLIFEASPYLLQHAANPVDWYPWGDAAFARARQLDRPIFLSIGYATCHWCHVMAHECFENNEVADLLNRYFVAIKIDREERPDIDQIYMTVCQLTTGSGGWPLNLLLTSEKSAFFAATYIPREAHDGNLGLLQLLTRVADLWHTDRNALVQKSQEITSALRHIQAGNLTVSPGVKLHDRPLRAALTAYSAKFDNRYGGFTGAPKFPQPDQFNLLLRLGLRYRDAQATTMALTSLRQIRNGGIYDQIGFGIHRYSVDERWFVPHFEKMLYDQALFTLAALEAWDVSREDEFARTVAETLTYMLTDLGDELGGFYCGEDADSEGEEGLFYLWTQEEIHALLGDDEGEVTCAWLGIVPEGNFEGRCIPHHPQPLATLAQRYATSPAALALRLEANRQRLHALRSRRRRPLLDDKILCAWNGLALAALSRAAGLLGNPAWIEAAQRCRDFVRKHLLRADGTLLRRWRRGQAGIPGLLEDYAFLVWGLIEWHQTNLDPDDLILALQLTARMEELFTGEHGSLYESSSATEDLPIRPMSRQDGALPSATSVAALNMVRLGYLGEDDGLRQRGEGLIRRNLAQLERFPHAYSQMLCALNFALGPVTTVTLVGNGDVAPWRLVLRAKHQPPLLVNLRPAGKNRGEIGAEGGIFAEVCCGRSCLPPAMTPTELAARLATQ